MFHNHKINLFILLVVSVIVGWQLFRPGYFSMHDDIQVIRLYEMDRCFDDGQIPCRWSPDMGAGYGQPMFTYYSVFPYGLGQLIHQIGFPFIDTVKILFFLCLLSSSFFAYLLLSELVSLAAALLGASLYLVTPYRALDIFVRGAMSEVWALALIPLVMWAVIRVLKAPNLKNSLWLAISSSAFLITHNITSIISLTVLTPFVFASLMIFKLSLHKIKYFVFGGLLGLGLSAFFVLPVALERGLIQTDILTTGYNDFRLHFVAISQLFFSQRWGYGASQPGSDDNLSFSIGIVQVIFLVLFPIIIFIKKKKQDNNIGFYPILFYLLSLLTLFFTHSKSVVIWERLSFFNYVQFPWRFLGLVAICTSIVSAFTVDFLPKKITNRIVIITIILTVVLNFRFFKFERVYPNIRDGVKLSGEEFNKQQKSAIADYLPKSAKRVPTDTAPNSPIIPKNSNVNIHYFDKRSNYFASEFDVFEDRVTVTIPVMYFPGWKIFHNGVDSSFPFTYDNDLGLITVELNKGVHKIQGFYEGTPIMMLGNLITFITIAVILILLAKNNEEK